MYLPPEDAEDVGDEQDQADEGGEALSVAFSLHRETLYYIADIRTQDHS